MRQLNNDEIKKVNGGFLPFAIQVGIYIVGQYSSIYGMYRYARDRRAIP